MTEETPTPSPIIAELTPEPTLQTLVCFNGPCVNATVDTPETAHIGAACALMWKTIKDQERFAVYVVTDFQGRRGLMYLRSYDRPEHAVMKVDQVTAISGMALLS